MKRTPELLKLNFVFFSCFFLYWKVTIHACLRHHPKSRTALHKKTTSILKAVMFLIRKKKYKSTVTSFSFSPSFLQVPHPSRPHAFKSCVLKCLKVLTIFESLNIFLFLSNSRDSWCYFFLSRIL